MKKPLNAKQKKIAENVRKYVEGLENYLASENAGSAEGLSALLTVYVNKCFYEGMSRETTMQAMSISWDFAQRISSKECDCPSHKVN
jgi:hypothetical protein